VPADNQRLNQGVHSIDSAYTFGDGKQLSHHTELQLLIELLVLVLVLVHCMELSCHHPAPSQGTRPVCRRAARRCQGGAAGSGVAVPARRSLGAAALRSPLQPLLLHKTCTAPNALMLLAVARLACSWLHTSADQQTAALCHGDCTSYQACTPCVNHVAACKIIGIVKKAADEL
jgi:hypothetical protein